jgi:hypothetical protein
MVAAKRRSLKNPQWSTQYRPRRKIIFRPSHEATWPTLLRLARALPGAPRCLVQYGRHVSFPMNALISAFSAQFCPLLQVGAMGFDVTGFRPARPAPPVMLKTSSPMRPAPPVRGRWCKPGNHVPRNVSAATPTIPTGPPRPRSDEVGSGLHAHADVRTSALHGYVRDPEVPR